MLVDILLCLMTALIPTAISLNDCHKGDPDCTTEDRPKLILFWTTFYGHVDFEFGLGRRPFEEHRCSVTNCETTADRSRLGQADVVVFHLRNMRNMEDTPKTRSPHQIYVFFLLEHPENQWNALNQYRGFFNATMTYRADSTVPIPYGSMVPRGGTPYLRPAPIQRNHTVAWFVSNCHTPGGRQHYYEALKHFIDIDVYGKCGDLQCPLNPTQSDVRMDLSCYEMLTRRYKFYLSFESHHCKQYVTEKFWNILRLTDNVIPVVLGGGDYLKLAPPHSYIDASKHTPRTLATLIKRLSTNDAEFSAYFDWRKDSTIIGQVESMRRGFCKLCAMVNSHSYRDFQPINDLDQWWTSEACDRTAFQKLARSVL